MNFIYKREDDPNLFGAHLLIGLDTSKLNFCGSITHQSVTKFTKIVLFIFFALYLLIVAKGKYKFRKESNIVIHL